MNKLLQDYGDLNIFIDAGYLFYYTIYGAFNMWKKSYPDRFKQKCPSKPQLEDLPDLTIDDRYIRCLETKMQRNLDKIFYVIKNKVFDGFTPPGLRPRVYFVKDSISSDYWRKTDLYPEYKMHRKLTGKYFKTSKAYDYLLSVIIPKLNMEEYFGIQTIEVDTAEADDIIMCLIKCMKHTHNAIISTDHDYIQILDKAKMFDLTGKEITAALISGKITGDPDIVLPNADYLKIKCLMGDTSDNIPAIYSGCGKKTAYKLFKNSAKLREALTERPGALKRIKLNQALIDADNIPMELQRKIVNEYSRIKQKA